MPLPITEPTSIFSGGTMTTIKSLISVLAEILKGILSTIGISLPPQGYIIVALSVLVALLYSMHRMTMELLKALVIGVIIAIVMHILGII